jgi:hypothetical protein
MQAASLRSRTHKPAPGSEQQHHGSAATGQLPQDARYQQVPDAIPAQQTACLQRASLASADSHLSERRSQSLSEPGGDRTHPPGPPAPPPPACHRCSAGMPPVTCGPRVHRCRGPGLSGGVAPFDRASTYPLDCPRPPPALQRSFSHLVGTSSASTPLLLHPWHAAGDWEYYSSPCDSILARRPMMTNPVAAPDGQAHPPVKLHQQQLADTASSQDTSSSTVGAWHAFTSLPVLLAMHGRPVLLCSMVAAHQGRPLGRVRWAPEGGHSAERGASLRRMLNLGSAPWVCRWYSRASGHRRR